MPTAPASVSDLAFTICSFSILVVPLAAVGLALINTGLGRSRSAAHSLVASLCVIALAAGVYLICGFAWEGFGGRAAHVIVIGGKPWDWIAAEPLFLRGLALDGSPACLAAWLQMFTVGMVALIPLGSGGDRWRLGAICASTALLAGWTYPLFAHWVWGGGWLAQLGINYGLGRGFIDVGGTSVIHVVGGFTALAIAWILGPRRGRFEPGGMPAAIPGHNTVLSLFGCLLAWTGWLGLNTAAALLFSSAEPTRVVLIGINTTLAAGSAALAVVVLTRTRFGKADASLTANGWVAGLVAGSASCSFANPMAAALIGAGAGALVVLAVGWFDGLIVDDPSGAIATHALSGMFGLLAVGFVPHAFVGRMLGADSGSSGQWLAQLVGIATLLGVVLPVTYALNWLLNLAVPQRVHPDGERRGLDLHELGADAYPDFVTLRDELGQR
jgi:Amt family ammonium transporter